jgi:hypothetical protein
MNAMDGKDVPFKVRYGGLDFHTETIVPCLAQLISRVT